MKKIKILAGALLLTTLFSNSVFAAEKSWGIYRPTPTSGVTSSNATLTYYAGSNYIKTNSMGGSTNIMIRYKSLTHTINKADKMYYFTNPGVQMFTVAPLTGKTQVTFMVYFGSTGIGEYANGTVYY